MRECRRTRVRFPAAPQQKKQVRAYLRPGLLPSWAHFGHTLTPGRPSCRLRRIFRDQGVSGSTSERRGLDLCLDHLREGDVLTVWKLDRLGRNTQHVLAFVDGLTSRGVGFRSLTEGLHTDGPMGKAMLTIMAPFAQLERDTMIERTRAGLAAAAANGRKGGRPRKVDDADTAKARTLRNKGVAMSDIAKMLGVSRATVYRYLSDDSAA